jgi:integrase/recombinase XerD
MGYKLYQQMEEGRVVALFLGVPEVDEYLRFLKNCCRQNTWINYAHDLQVFLNVVQKPVLEVNPRDILSFIEHQRQIARPRRRPRGAPDVAGLSPHTVKRRLSAISGLYGYLSVCGDTPLKNNPVPRSLISRGSFWKSSFGNERTTPLIKVSWSLPRPLDATEISRFLNSLRRYRDKAMVWLMLLAGLRKSEVLGLNVEDVDFGQRTVWIRDAKGGRQRAVAVSEAVLQALLRYLNEERPQSSSPRIFLVLKGPHRGQPLSVTGLDEIIEYHREQAGAPGVRCHRLRHTCFTRLREAGMSLEALQAQAGHKSITSTMMYLHLCPRRLQEEYRSMSELVFGANKEDTGND